MEARAEGRNGSADTQLSLPLTSSRPCSTAPPLVIGLEGGKGDQVNPSEGQRRTTRQKMRTTWNGLSARVSESVFVQAAAGIQNKDEKKNDFNYKDDLARAAPFQCIHQPLPHPHQDGGSRSASTASAAFASFASAVPGRAEPCRKGRKHSLRTHCGEGAKKHSEKADIQSKITAGHGEK